MRKRFTSEELSIIDLGYHGLTKKELECLLPSRSWEVIRVIANRRGLKRSNGAYREDRGCPQILDFSSVDTEEKSYIMGLLFAGGSLHKDGRHVEIKLGVRDYQFLCNIASRISSNPNVRVKDHNGKKQSVCIFTVSSKVFYEQLVDLGLTYNKTRVIGRPRGWLKPNLFASFIRGYFDGDGSVSERRGFPDSFISKLSMNVTGTHVLMSFIQEWFCMNSVYTDGLTETKSKLSKHVTMLSGGGRKARAFLKLIYTDAKLYLDHKYNLAIKYINMSVDHRGRDLNERIFYTKRRT